MIWVAIVGILLAWASVMIKIALDMRRARREWPLPPRKSPDPLEP